MSGDTLITIDNNIFSTLTTGLRELLIGGVVIIQNDILTTATITEINANNQLTVEGDLTTWDGYQIYIHAPGLNVSNLNSGYGFLGVGTTTPTTPLSVNGAITTSITTIILLSVDKWHCISLIFTQASSFHSSNLTAVIVLLFIIMLFVFFLFQNLTP